MNTPKFAVGVEVTMFGPGCGRDGEHHRVIRRVNGCTSYVNGLLFNAAGNEANQYGTDVSCGEFTIILRRRKAVVPG